MGVSRQAVEKAAARAADLGLKLKGEDGKYDARALESYMKESRKWDKNQPGGEALDGRRRKLELECDKLAMELAIKRGEYIRESDHDAAVQRVIQTALSELGNIGKSVAQKVFEKPPGVAADIIQGAINNALAEMQRSLEQGPGDE